MSSIETLWEQLTAGGDVAGAIRVDDVHPCDLYAAIDAEGRRGLVLVTDTAPPQPPVLEAVSVMSSRRQDGRYSLGFWLVASTLSEPFAHLCQDLVDESRDIDPTYASGFLLTRLARWRRLLKGERGMSLNEIRGLVGELLVLNQCLDHWPAIVVVEGWLGPLEAAQDFVLPTLRIEAKAIQPDARVVRISSADQLDSSVPTRLAVITLVTIATDENGVSATALVSAIRARLVALGEHGSVTTLDGRLAAAGYSDSGNEGAISFRVDDIRYFEVTDGFPAMTRGMLPAGVAEIRYDIELTALLPFVTSLLP